VKTTRKQDPNATLDELLALMRKHKVLAFEQGDLKVSFHPSALVVDEQPAKAKAEPPELDAAGRAVEDPDLYYSVRG
jgi:hypothetical protein